jgi:hypothetical protein
MKLNPTELALSCIAEYVNKHCASCSIEELKDIIGLLSNVIIKLDSELKSSEINLAASKTIISKFEEKVSNSNPIYLNYLLDNKLKEL